MSKLAEWEAKHEEFERTFRDLPKGCVTPEVRRAMSAVVNLAGNVLEETRRLTEEASSYRETQASLAGRLSELSEEHAEGCAEIEYLREQVQRLGGELGPRYEGRRALKPGPFKLKFWVDGCCLGNGGPKGRMGAGVIGCLDDGEQVEWSVSFPDETGTSARAELLAVREALKRCVDRQNSDVVIYSDSQYAVAIVNEEQKAKANRVLVEEVRRLVRTCHSCELLKVPRGGGFKNLNARADALANQAARTVLLPGSGTKLAVRRVKN